MPLLLDRKSTRLNSSHLVISYAVFCLKKKKQHKKNFIRNHNHQLRHQRAKPHCVHGEAALAACSVRCRSCFVVLSFFFFFFFNDTATTEIYTLSLHDALPIYEIAARQRAADEKRKNEA